ncbi:hypothetical protein GCM10027418_03070 [Mariniluteicoccus endophyticus]
MGPFDKMKDAFTPKKEADAANAVPAAEAEERAATEARLQAEEKEVAEAQERAAAEERLRADEQAVADAEKAANEKAAAEAAAQEAENRRVAGEQAAARAEEERRNAEAEAARHAEEDRRNAEAAAAAKPAVSTRRVIDVVNHDSDPNTRTGQGMDPELGRLMEAALRKALADNGLPNANKDDGALGTSFLEAYSVWQGHLGYDGDDTNGVPGRASLEKLAEATGMFRVED